MTKNEVFGKISGFIDKDTIIMGEIKFNDSFRIDGKFKGKILWENLWKYLVASTSARASRSILE